MNITTLFVAICCSVMAAAQPYNFAPVDKLLSDSARAMGGLQGKTATVILSPTATLFTKATGVFTADSVVPIASSSKWLSGAVIMSLVDAGKLSLDDSCGKYLTTFNGSKAGITIRQLMSHTSGLPGNTGFESNRSLTLSQAVDSIGLTTTLLSTPGTQFRYGGASMHVAGRIVEIIEGKPWDSVFAERIARPLGMTLTDYEGLGQTDNPQIAGGARSSANEYARFLTMLLNKGLYNGKRILSEQSVVIMSGDQTRGAAIVSSPFDAYQQYDTNMAKSRYGIGNWVEMPTKSSGVVYDNSSQGAFGFSPWIDWNRNVAGVISVRSLMRNVTPTYITLKLLLRNIIDTAKQPANNYELTVTNGYGGGRYKAGDTVHIFARAMQANEVFGEWLNDANLVFSESRNEWHVSFIMPSANVNCTATFRPLDTAAVRIRYEQIRGEAENKNVYYSFPPAMQGVAFLLHGSGGSARGWLPNNIENVQFVKDLLADSIGVIITECEERTLDRDVNGDGKIRWYVSAPLMDSSI
ncbi:MAG: serine hydrolase, partial [Candidatus Kapabacteria bacterium]|nr:serine hydrolase [Candidatus Kapabacteria bacterium]